MYIKAPQGFIDDTDYVGAAIEYDEKGLPGAPAAKYRVYIFNAEYRKYTFYADDSLDKAQAELNRYFEEKIYGACDIFITNGGKLDKGQ